MIKTEAFTLQFLQSSNSFTKFQQFEVSAIFHLNESTPGKQSASARTVAVTLMVIKFFFLESQRVPRNTTYFTFSRALQANTR